MLFGTGDVQHALQRFGRGIRLCCQTQPGVEHGVGVLGLGFAGSGARKAHKGTQQGVPQGVCRGVRRAEIVGHGSVLSSVKICKEYSPFIRAIQAAEKSPLTAEGAGNEKIRAMQELLLPASQPAEHDLCRSSA